MGADWAVVRQPIEISSPLVYFLNCILVSEVVFESWDPCGFLVACTDCLGLDF